MNTNKTTYIAALTYAIENLADAPQDVLDKLVTLRGQHENRGNYISKKSIADAEQNAAKREQIYNVLAANGKMTISEIMAADPSIAPSNQKVTSLMRGLVDEGRVVKTIEKRKSYFAIAA